MSWGKNRKTKCYWNIHIIHSIFLGNLKHLRSIWNIKEISSTVVMRVENILRSFIFCLHYLLSFLFIVFANFLSNVTFRCIEDSNMNIKTNVLTPSWHLKILTANNSLQVMSILHCATYMKILLVVILFLMDH